MILKMSLKRISKENKPRDRGARIRTEAVDHVL